MIKICLLGMNTVDFEKDIDFSAIERLGDTVYAYPTTPDEVVATCQGATAVLVNKTMMDEYVISRLPDLKYIGIFATGYNNVDLIACQRYGVTCCNAPNYSTNAVVQHATALLLNLAGNLSAYAQSVNDGDWLRAKGFCYYAYPMHEVYSKKIGIVGYGNIGKRMAKIADALGMVVLIYNRSTIKNCPYRQVDKDTLFQESDFISLHCPLNRDSEKMINEQSLSLMKPSALLINTARGGLVDEVALTSALNAGKIAGAGLDVLAVEPMQENCPLRGAKNCIITPHAAWLPQETRQALTELVADTLQAFLEGNPKNVVS